MSQFSTLLKDFHSTKSKNEKEKLRIKLAKYYYEEDEIEKATLLLEEVKNKNIKDYHYILGLIELYHNNISKARKLFEKEIKNFSNNTIAKRVLEKIQEHTELPFMTISLILIMIFFYIIIPHPLSFSNLLNYAVYSYYISFQNIFSSIFIHLNLFHLIFNIIALFVFGRIVEKKIGSFYFTFLFIISAALGNYFQALFSTTETFIVGASAGIFGIFGMLIMRSPTLNIKLFGLINSPLILVFGSLFGISIFLPTSIIASAQVAHIVGLFTGILYAAFYFPKTISTFYNWLAISFGFLFFLYGIESLFSRNLLEWLSIILYIIGGIALILFGYSKLNREIMRSNLK